MLKSKTKWNDLSLDIDQSLTDDSIITQLLRQRGYDDETSQQDFLYPKLSEVQSPEEIDQINVATERIHDAIANGEKIIVYGDYDADGITSTALLLKTLFKLNANCHYYIPHRLNEGYGLNERAIKQVHDEGAKVIITVDNGIASVEEAKLVKQLDMDLIITDHHAIPEILPEALAIIHPQLSANDYFKLFAGVGVAFQLARQLLGDMPLDLLDLVAIGTVADLVPLREDNRILVYYGLKQLNETNHLGLKKLIEKSGIDRTLTETEIGFAIAPRLNSVGRLTNASLAVELLLTDNEERASEIVDEMNELNRERQEIARKIYLEAEEKLEEDTDDGIIMLYDEDWHEGVLGIVASRLVKKYSRPVFIFKYNIAENSLKGSARSIPAFNIYENCSTINHLFTKFGGHSQAAGMTLPIENLSEIKQQLNVQLWEQLSKDDLREELNIHCTINVEEMTESLVTQLNLLAPFGMDNEKPKFLLEEKAQQIQQIGKDKSHLKLMFQQEHHRVNAIGFQMGHLYNMLSLANKLSVVGSLQINEWNGHRTVQIVCEDIAVHERQIFDHRGKWQQVPLENYLQHYNKHTLIDHSNEGENFKDKPNITYITYDDDNEHLLETDILYINYLPNDLDDLAKIITKTNPSTIYAGYEIEHHTYLSQLPTREQFKWLYRHLMYVENQEVKEIIGNIIKIQKWDKDKVIFMMSVFNDLEFFYLEERKLFMNDHSNKKDLTQSKTYQQKLKEIEVGKVLYYSTYDDLYEWIMQWMESSEIKSEVLVK